MKSPDFTAPAAVYVQVNGRGWSMRGRAPKRYYRFDSLALAVKYAIEDADANFNTVVIETDDAEFAGDTIRSLYDRDDYPLPKNGR